MADDETPETPETPDPQVPEVAIEGDTVAPVKKTRKRRMTAAEKRGEDGPVRIDDYPPRPYLEAITPEHRAALEEAHQLPKE